VYPPALDRAQAQVGNWVFSRRPGQSRTFAPCWRTNPSTPYAFPPRTTGNAYMAVEACKAGKDVWVEAPACAYVEEGAKMVEAARKYNRVAQAGTMQRSGGFFQKGARNREERRAGRSRFLPRL